MRNLSDVICLFKNGEFVLDNLAQNLVSRLLHIRKVAKSLVLHKMAIVSANSLMDWPDWGRATEGGTFRKE
jgi:hypothetical protein